MRHHFSKCTRRLMVGLLLIGLLTCGGCLPSATAPKVPVLPAEKAARDAVITYAQRLADSFDAAGSQLQSGSLSTAVDVNQQLQTANAAARKEAFQPLDELLNNELGGEKWDAARAGQLFQHISTGLRSLP